MKRTLIAISVLILMTACHLGYGPLQDQSKFVSARLADDKRTVLFSFHRFAYRAATGWRAFPDGGIPDYATDITLFGTYDLKLGKSRFCDVKGIRNGSRAAVCSQFTRRTGTRH